MRRVYTYVRTKMTDLLLVRELRLLCIESAFMKSIQIQDYLIYFSSKMINFALIS